MRTFIKHLLVIGSAIFISVLMAACAKDPKTVKIGIVESDVSIWQPTVQQLKKDGINLELTPFNSFDQPNSALFHQEIEINAFQSAAFLKDWNHENQANLIAAGKTYVAPMRIYSKQIKRLSQLKRGDTIALPDDNVNKARALKLLQRAGVLKLDRKRTPNVGDVIKNRHKFQFFTVDASVTARDMSDATIAVVNDEFAREAKLNPKNALASENVHTLPSQYTGVFAINKKDRHDKTLQKVIRVFKSNATRQRLRSATDHSAIAKW